jgi:hypothetical protein
MRIIRRTLWILLCAALLVACDVSSAPAQSPGAATADPGVGAPAYPLPTTDGYPAPASPAYPEPTTSQ